MLGGMGLLGAHRRIQHSRPSPITPSDLNPTAWYKPNYTGGNWNDSWGGHHLVWGGGPPSVGTAVNGYSPAKFVAGHNDYLYLGGNSGVILGNASYSITMLIKPTSGVARTTSPYYQNALIAGNDTNEWQLYYTSDGVTAMHYDSTDHEVTFYCPVGEWSAVDIRFNSGSKILEGRRNGGDWHQVVCNAGMNNANTYGMFMGAESTYYYAGQILEFITYNTGLADFDLDGIRSYYYNTYLLDV